MGILDIELEEEPKEEIESAEYKELKLKTDINHIAEQIEKIELNSDEDVAEAAEWLRKNKKTQKIVTEFFEEDRAEKYAEYRAVMDKIKAYTDVLKKTERSVKQKMGAYQQEKEKQRRIEEEKKRKEEEERQKKEEKNQPQKKEAPQVEMPETPKKEEKVPEGITYVETWQFEIEDKEKIPAEYLIVDEKKVRAMVKAMKGDTKIPGVRVFTTQEVRARA